ncbi:hypothetical protein NECAME_08543 [Necator americanus]|uniref:Uncharacterized protein n=1 Tax=Necator americanus TaxID=51031 RepID=W2TJM2_NECAM|nr:hypothetical protein NECAME_08543 [Necator americanus]ETN81366.1 hypothetical protein NECAME_08543 [Necator americanus]
MSRKSESSTSEESLGQRSVATSVIRDTGTKVQLMFKAHGLKKRKSLLNSIVTVFKKGNVGNALSEAELWSSRFVEKERSSYGRCI